METKCSDSKTFQLIDDEQLIGEITYEQLFKLHGTIKIGVEEPYEIKTEGVFSTTIHVRQNAVEIATLKMNWRGQIVIAFILGEQFVLKPKGVFSSKYILENEAQVPLIQYEPSFNWKKFNYNYSINFEEKPKNYLLVLIGIFATNYYISTMSGATSGAI
jgi:hypothetical protein